MYLEFKTIHVMAAIDLAVAVTVVAVMVHKPG